MKRRIRIWCSGIGCLTALLFAFAVTGSAVKPEQAMAGHDRCYDYWRHSGHTDNVRWYHCHFISDSGAYRTERVHICGYSGTLHGVSVEHIDYPLHPDGWSSWNHQHDTGGEGC